MTDTTIIKSDKMKDYPFERTVFGLLVIGGVVATTLLLFYKAIPKENIQVVPIMVGALLSSLGVIVNAVWKTSMTERQQQATIQQLATAAAAPLTTTTTQTVERTGTDGQNNPTPVEGPSQVDTGTTGQGSPGAVPDSGAGTEPLPVPLPSPADGDTNTSAGTETGTTSSLPSEPPSIDGMGEETESSS